MENPVKARLVELFEGQSLAQIAKKLGENYHTVRNWVTPGRTSFPVNKLAEIAKLTNVNLTWFLTGEGEKFITPAGQLNLDDALRSVIRDIVKEEIANERRHLVLPIDVGKKKGREGKKTA